MSPAAFLAIAIVGILLLSATAWNQALRAYWREGAFLQAIPRGPATWGLMDVTIGVVVWLVAQIAALNFAMQLTGKERTLDFSRLTLSEQLLLMTAGGVASLVTLFTMLIWMYGRSKGTRFDLCLAGPWRSHMALGCRWFVMLVAPVYAVQISLAAWMPSSHPLIELLRKDPRWQNFLPAIFSAVVAAPLFEEYFFRVILQGWLENTRRADVALPQIVFGFSRRDWARRRFQGTPGERGAENGAAIGQPKETVDSVTAEAASASEASSLGADARPDRSEENPYATPRNSATAAEPGAGNATDGPPSRFEWMPVVVSSLAFAAVHIGHGPDPIPLFLLAMGLGYLFQKTHSVWPGVVVHALFNGYSLFLLWLSLRIG